MSATQHSGPSTQDFFSIDDPVRDAARKATTDAMIAAIKDSAAHSPNLRRAREAAERERRAAASARIPPALDAAQRSPGSRTHPMGNPFPCASDADDRSESPDDRCHCSQAVANAEDASQGKNIPTANDARTLHSSIRNSHSAIPPTPDNGPSSTETFYTRTSPEERNKLRRLILDRATCRKLMELHKLASKGVSYDALCRFARQVKTEARVQELAELLTPNPAEIPNLIERLAGVECIDALLHAEEEGSAKKLARNMKHYLRLRDQDLKKHIADQREATKERCTQSRREGQKECTEIRAAAQRDCTKMRTDAQRNVADLRTQCADHMNERRIETHRDTVQFKADCAAGRDRDYYRFKRGHPLRTDAERTQAPPPVPPSAPASYTEPGAPATGSLDAHPPTSKVSNPEPEVCPVSVGCVPDAPSSATTLPSPPSPDERNEPPVDSTRSSPLATEDSGHNPSTPGTDLSNFPHSVHIWSPSPADTEKVICSDRLSLSINPFVPEGRFENSPPLQRWVDDRAIPLFQLPSRRDRAVVLQKRY